MSDYTLSQYLGAFSLYSQSNYSYMKPENGLNPRRLFRAAKYKLEAYIEEPNYFAPSGLLTFHGSQGFGKTLSACAVYCHQLLEAYPCCILCTNTDFKDRPYNAYIAKNHYSDEEYKAKYEEVKSSRLAAFKEAVKIKLEEDFLNLDYPEFTVEEYIAKRLPFYFFNEARDFENFKQEISYQLRDIMTDELITPEKIKDGTFKKVTVEYWGIDCLKYINNGVLGVLYFIDEIQLEFNNLDRNIPVEVMIEVCQQRKQRKHIVGTSQCFKRSAKFIREQTHDAVACKCFFGLIQYNKVIEGESIDENSSGKLTYHTKKRLIFFHDVDLYQYYDTYAKMKRYNNEWQGRPSIITISRN